jgi:hypothetical protein
MNYFKYLSNSRDGGWSFQKTGEPDAFELEYWIQSNGAGFRACSAQLEQELRDHWALQRYRPTRTEHLNLILANLIVADRKQRGKGVKFHRQANAFARRTAEWPEFLSARTLSAVVDGLESLGYVEVLLGAFDDASHNGFLSQVRPTDKLRNLWRAFDTAPVDIKPALDTPLIVLRGKKPSRGKGPFVEPIHSEKFMAIEDRVRAYNEYLSRQSISLDFESQPRGAMSCRVHRVFNDETAEIQTLSRGGRFYGAFWQRIRDDRSKLLINGEPTVELDYGSLHIRMMYHLNGMSCIADPYLIPELSDFLDDRFASEQRDFVQELTFRLINSNGRQVRALGTATGEDIEREFEARLKDGLPLKVVLDVIRDAHAPVANGFGKGVGVALQNLDSEICDQIHHALMEQDIPVLSVHDSFIVGRSVEDELRSAMIHFYKSVLGTEFDPVIKKVESDSCKVIPVKEEPASLDSEYATIVAEVGINLGRKVRRTEAPSNNKKYDDMSWLEDEIRKYVI